MEVWDLYTEGQIKTGETHLRGTALPKNRFHLVVHVWIVNAKGEYLISQRAASRPSYPLMWECVGGSVLRGESSVDGAVREVKEEVGIDLSPAAGILVDSEVRKIVNGTVFNDIKDVWLFPYDGEILLENATTDEVADAKWMTKSEIKEYYRSGKLVPTLAYFFERF